MKFLKFYQKTISPLLPDSCRYYPTCSSYMIGAIQKHGTGKGLLMGSVRILRCNPFFEGGTDPVPDFFTFKRNHRPLTEAEEEDRLYELINHRHR